MDGSRERKSEDKGLKVSHPVANAMFKALETSIAWHQRRRRTLYDDSARHAHASATYMPESELQSLSAMAHFHIKRCVCNKRCDGLSRCDPHHRSWNPGAVACVEQVLSADD
jgi:hypothetical protein